MPPTERARTPCPDTEPLVDTVMALAPSQASAVVGAIDVPPSGAKLFVPSSALGLGCQLTVPPSSFAAAGRTLGSARRRYPLSALPPVSAPPKRARRRI